MRTLGQLSFIGLAASLLSFLSGCGTLPGPDGGVGASPGAGGSVGGSGGGTGAGGTTGSGGVGGQVTQCEPGIPVSSQIPRMKNAEYDNVIYDLLEISTLTAGGTAKPSSLLVDDHQGAMNNYDWNGYVNAAAQIAAHAMSVPASKAKFMACDPAAVATCFEDTIRAFGRKAFRRVLTEEEVTSFMRLTTIEPAGTNDEIAEAILQAFLMSPSFITLPELGQEQEAGALKLTQHEIAVRLSFLLWDSIPDQILSDAADNGQLATKEQIRAQAVRLLENREKSAGAVSTYHRFYLDMRPGSHWWATPHDATLFPEYSPDLIEPLMEELDLFFEEVAFEGGQFKDLFLSNVAYINNQTAPLYGLNPADYTATLEREELDATQRPGFLTRAGFLTSFSAAEMTSPILRGAFISQKILGLDTGIPDPDALNTPIPPGEYGSVREMIVALTSGAKCVGCHSKFVNPPGFVMENYDSIGRWQINDSLGDPIDPTGNVLLTQEGTPVPVSGSLQLMTELGLGPSARRNYAQKVVEFATDRTPNTQDACYVNELDLKLGTDGYTILNLFADLTQADSFRLRTRGAL